MYLKYFSLNISYGSNDDILMNFIAQYARRQFHGEDRIQLRFFNYN